MLYILVIVLAVAADQAVKFYVVSHLALYESAPLIPGLWSSTTSRIQGEDSPSSRTTHGFWQY